MASRRFQRSWMSALALGLLLQVLPARAAESPQQACEPDREKFCSDVPKGGGRVVKCLREHESELSGPCKEVFERRRPKHERSAADAGS